MEDTFVIESLTVGFEMEISNKMKARKKELRIELADGKKAVIHAYKLNNKKILQMK